jgi:hypothetical protein
MDPRAALSPFHGADPALSLRRLVWVPGSLYPKILMRCMVHYRVFISIAMALYMGGRVANHIYPDALPHLLLNNP